MKAEIKFAELIAKWFLTAARDFPWRKIPSPYFVWLAEVMSQQTVIAALLAYFQKFTERFPTVEALASASEEEVLSSWAGLGYYSRARNLHKTAKILANDWLKGKGRWPTTAQEWETLPGIGPYTSAAIAAQCFGENVVVWDGNVTRVMARYFGEPKPHSTSFREKGLNFLRASLLDSMEGSQSAQTVNLSSSFNQGLMELGALVCTPKAPKCMLCPLNEKCYAFRNQLQNQIPEPKPRKQFIEIKARVFVILKIEERQKFILFVRRERGNWYPGLYDFPTELGGVLEPVRKLADFTNKKTARNSFTARHTITHHKIELLPQIHSIEEIHSETLHKGFGEGVWIPLSELRSGHSALPIATTARKVMKNLFSQNFDFEIGV